MGEGDAGVAWDWASFRAKVWDAGDRVAKGIGTTWPFHLIVTVIPSDLMKVACKVLPWESVQSCMTSAPACACCKKATARERRNILGIFIIWLTTCLLRNAPTTRELRSSFVPKD